MRIDVVRAGRRPRCPLWAVLLVLLWLGLGGAAIGLGAYLGQPPQLCLFKRLTGFACPTCGFTRGLFCLLRGQFRQAWLCNPLLFSALALLFAAAALRIVFARSVRISLTRTERRLAWLLALVLFFANWGYVILCVG